MEDPRLSRMYARALLRDTASLGSRGGRWLRGRQTGLRWLAAALTVFGVGFGYYAHIEGRFGRLKKELKAAPPETSVLLVGGQEPLVLERAPLNDGASPEFLSATFLPGRGMGLLQVMAMIPGRGVTSLLQAPSVDDLAAAESAASQSTPPADVSAHLPLSIELPWAGGIPGSAAPGGRALEADWHGRALQLPANTGGADLLVSEGGLLRAEPSDSIEHDVMPDGGSVETQFATKNFHGSWPSETEVAITALLSSRALDLKIVARNVGHEPEPMGVGWIPSLVLPSRSRRQATLRVPSTDMEEMRNGRATGKLVDVTGSALDFSSRSGKRLDDAALDATFTHLRTGFLDNGPVLELRDVDSGVGLRMTALSSQIEAVQVKTTGAPGVVTLGFQSNLNDPLSRVWRPETGGGIPVLQPGQALEWHVRFELVALTSTSAAQI